MRMMMQQMQQQQHLVVVETLDGSSSDEQHVVGRMEIGGPEDDDAAGQQPRLLLEQEQHNNNNNNNNNNNKNGAGGNRVLYGEKVIVDDEEAEDEEEEEEKVARAGGDDHHHHRLLSNHALKLHLLQQQQQHGYEDHRHHHARQQIAASNGEEGHSGQQQENNGNDGYGVSGQQHHGQQQEHNGNDGYGVSGQQHHGQQRGHNGNDGYGVCGQQHHGQQQQQHHHRQQQEDEEEDDMVEPKLGELGSAMLRLDSTNNNNNNHILGGGEIGRATIDADTGIVQSLPPDSSGGGGGGGGVASGGKAGRGQTSKEPPIEWSEGATTVLLQAFGEKYQALDRGNFTSKIWADITARVNAHKMTTGMDGCSLVEGPPKTREQCRIKVDNLKKRYKAEREKQRVSGSTISKWPFFDTMEELIGSNPKLMRGGVVVGIGGRGGMDSPGLPLEIVGQQPLAIRSSVQEGERIYYLEPSSAAAAAGAGEGDQTSQTVPKLSPLLARGKRKRALKDMEQENVNAPSLRALFEGHNIPGVIIDAMLQEDMDENTLINTKDITALIEQLQIKHRLQIKLGPAERIKQAIEEAREK